MKYQLDRYGRKIQVTDDNRVIEPQKRSGIMDLFTSDAKARQAQKTDVVKDGREDLAADANDDLNAFLKSQGKVTENAQDADVMFEFSSPANDKAGEFVTDAKKTEKTNLKGDVKGSPDKRDEYVAEVPADDLSGFESQQKKTQKAQKDEEAKEKAAEKKEEKAEEKKEEAKEKAEEKKEEKKAEAIKDEDVEKKVKDRWAKLLGSVLFDPYQLKDSKTAIAFKIGSDYVLMKSAKPTRTEWITARSLVSELRDPSILRTAQMVEDEVGKVEAVTPAEEPLEVPEGMIQEPIKEEEAEVADLQSAIDALEAGDTDEAKGILETLLAEEQEEVEEVIGEGEGEQYRGGEEVVEEGPVEEVPAEVVAKQKKASVDPIAPAHKLPDTSKLTQRTKKTPESATPAKFPANFQAKSEGAIRQMNIQD